jgi:hypothetical protein
MMILFIVIVLFYYSPHLFFSSGFDFIFLIPSSSCFSLLHTPLRLYCLLFLSQFFKLFKHPLSSFIFFYLKFILFFSGLHLNHVSFHHQYFVLSQFSLSPFAHFFQFFHCHINMMILSLALVFIFRTVILSSPLFILNTSCFLLLTNDGLYSLLSFSLLDLQTVSSKFSQTFTSVFFLCCEQLRV